MSPASPRTVVVLPFANISGHPADDWIGIGIAETVTTDVERMGRFSVVRREALLYVLDDTRLDARVLSDETTGRRLAHGIGATWMVAGGVQRLGDQLRVTARIVDVETGVVLETVMVDGRFDEMFALQVRAGGGGRRAGVPGGQDDLERANTDYRPRGCASGGAGVGRRSPESHRGAAARSASQRTLRRQRRAAARGGRDVCRGLLCLALAAVGTRRGRFRAAAG